MAESYQLTGYSLPSLLLTLSQITNFRLFQTETDCTPQFQI